VARRRWITTGELARELGLSVRTIQRYRADGLITPEIVTRGGHGRWDLEKVQDQIRRMNQEQAGG
jgi:DNA-binding transcriptional MerR regulator